MEIFKCKNRFIPLRLWSRTHSRKSDVSLHFRFINMGEINKWYNPEEMSPDQRDSYHCNVTGQYILLYKRIWYNYMLVFVAGIIFGHRRRCLLGAWRHLVGGWIPRQVTPTTGSLILIPPRPKEAVFKVFEPKQVDSLLLPWYNFVILVPRARQKRANCPLCPYIIIGDKWDQ